MPALEKLFFARVPARSRVLDVCCGCGHVTKELVHRGYCVTGVDISAQLVSIAQDRIPQARFCVADVTQFTTDDTFDAALSTFDALNHLLTVEDLTEALQRVHRSIVPGGIFVFDINLEEAYFADLRSWHTTVRDSDVSLVRGTYDLNGNMARTDLIWFVKTNNPDMWERRTASVYERCYREAEILEALKAAGWADVEWVSAREAGVQADLGLGRLFFTARA